MVIDDLDTLLARGQANFQFVRQPKLNQHEIVFFMLPFSIIVANYIETIDKLWFKEMLVVLLILVPITNLLL